MCVWYEDEHTSSALFMYLHILVQKARWNSMRNAFTSSFIPIFLIFLYAFHISIPFPPKHDITDENQGKYKLCCLLCYFHIFSVGSTPTETACNQAQKHETVFYIIQIMLPGSVTMLNKFKDLIHRVDYFLC
jgi:hypothetical protein